MSSRILFICLSLLLSGCSDSKEKLQGKREPIVLLQDDLSISNDLKSRLITLSEPINNKNWSQAGFDHTNIPPHTQLAQNLKLLWSTSIGRGSHSRNKLLVNFVSSGDLIFTMDTRGNVSARNLKDGREVWSFSSSPLGREDDTLGGGLCCSDETVFITTSFSQAIALDARTGKKRWQIDLPNPCRSNPCISGKKLYTLTLANEVICLSTHDGQELWTYTGLPETSSILGGGKVVKKGDIVVSALSSGEIVALNDFNGSPLWVDALTSSVTFESEAGISDIRARPFISKDNAIFISNGGRMLAQSVSSGEKVWQKQIGGLRSPCVSDDFMFMVSNHSELVAIHIPTGGIKWVQNLPVDRDGKKVNWAGPILANKNLVLTSSNGRVSFFSPQNGHLIHTINIDRSILLSPIVVQRTLLVLSDDGRLHAWK